VPPIKQSHNCLRPMQTSSQLEFVTTEYGCFSYKSQEVLFPGWMFPPPIGPYGSFAWISPITGPYSVKGLSERIS